MTDAGFEVTQPRIDKFEIRGTDQQRLQFEQDLMAARSLSALFFRGEHSLRQRIGASDSWFALLLVVRIEGHEVLFQQGESISIHGSRAWSLRNGGRFQKKDEG